MEIRLKIGAAVIAAGLATAATMAACSDDSTGPQSTTYTANLSGANEVPTVAGAASGTATFTLNGKMLSYVVTVSGLSGNALASHIHVGASSANGNIVYPFNAAGVQTGQVASGIVDLSQPVSNGTTSISGDSLLTLLNSGLLYTNVHTASNPGGEIRGQITRASSNRN
jgi:hypothetical protein